MNKYRGRGVLPRTKNPFSLTSCFHHRPQANVKGRGKARQIYDIFSATLPQLPTAFSSGNFLSVRGCSFSNSTQSSSKYLAHHPYTLEKHPVFSMPFRKALNEEPSLVYLHLGSWYCKSDGMYSESQLASTLHKLLRI